MSTLVAGRGKLAVLDSSSLVINTAFSIHAWDSGIWNTDHFSVFEGSLKNYFMSIGNLKMSMEH